MLGFNGGLIGTPRTATTIEASGIWSLNESNLFIGQGLWPQNILAPDPYFSDVSLLLAGDGTNGSTTVKDYSSLALAPTAVGDAQISVAQSKYYGSSLAFDGSGDYLSIPNTEESDLYAGDFTIEFWIRISNTTGLQCIFATGWPIAIYVSSGSILLVVKNNVNAADPNLISGLSGTGVLSTTEWTHIACTRTAVGSSNTFKIFKNGTEVASQTATGSIARSNAPYFGIGNNPAYASYFNGYINDLRITKGVARYTANFTPPDSFLRGGLDAYVSLLLRGNGTNGSTAIIDESYTPKTITQYGAPIISSTQSKFGGTSLYLDGTSYLQTPVSSEFATGTSDFTFECWYYPTGKVDPYPRIFQVGTNFWVTSDNWALLDRHDSASTKFSWACYNLGVNTLLLQSTTEVQDNTWYHLALVRSGSTFRLFVNGVQESTYTNSGAVTTSAATSAWIGSAATSGDSQAKAYIDDLRFTRNVARYTSNFTPPGAL